MLPLLAVLSALTTTAAPATWRVPAAVAGPLGAPAAGCELALAQELAPLASNPAAALDFTAVYLANVAGPRWIWALRLQPPVELPGSSLIVYLDADNDLATGRQDKAEVRGCDLMYQFLAGAGGEASHNLTLAKSRPARSRWVLHDDVLYLSDDLPLAGDATTAQVRFRLLSQRNGPQGKSTDWITVSLPRRGGELPPVVKPSGRAFRGLPRATAEPAVPRPAADRAVPALPWTTRPRVARPATVERQRVAVTVHPTTAQAGPAVPLRWGFPLPLGTLFDPANVRLLRDGRELPADVAATAFWPDGSLKFVLLTTATALVGERPQELAVEFGSAVQRQPAAAVTVTLTDSLRLDSSAAQWEWSLRPLRLRQVRCLPATLQPDGRWELRDTAGRLYELHATSAEVEYASPQRVVVKLRGPYQDATGRQFQSGQVRLTARAGATALEVAHTLVVDQLDWEFSDLGSLALRLTTPADPRGLPAAAPAQVVARDESGIRLLGGPGGSVEQGAVAQGGLAVAVTDFVERYPKLLRLRPEGIDVELLPPLDGPAQPPADLPAHVGFGFLDGAYRLKWGMATTERLVLQAYREQPAAALKAAVASAAPPAVVVPPAWYQETAALGELLAADGKLFRAWDERFALTFADHLRRKAEKREYGYLNWGDWHGERTTNWGNNEYDLPHGLYLQSARTGDPQYLRLALAGARHQADVDIIHAYPDPFYVGGNIPHSVFHNGEWSEQISDRSWSFPYNSMHAAWNGHTWASGLCDAWCLTGDPAVMDAATLLGEHITWRMSREFKELGTHERSAGWSAHAIAAIYGVTADPEHLAALTRIVDVAYREQRFDDGGAWPHLLPGDHAGGVAGARGNVAFLIGVLLSGIDDHLRLTGDPRARRSIPAGVGWLRTQWVPEFDAFSYTSSPAFRAQVTRSSGGLNNLVVLPVLRAAELTGDAALLEIGARGLMGALLNLDGFGKSFAQAAHFAPAILARLQRLGAAQQPYGERLTWTQADLRRETLRQAAPPTALRLRGPLEKTVWFRHRGGPAEVQVSRETWGARPKEEPTGWVRLLDPAGRTVVEGVFSTDTLPWTARLALPAAAVAGAWRVVVHDDLRARWDLVTPGPRVVALDPPVQFGGIGQTRWYFQVPAGQPAFELQIEALHDGLYGLLLLDPAGRPRGEVEATAVRGQVNQRRLAMPAGSPAGLWSVVAYAGMDAVLSLRGVPPYLAPSAADWFDPTAR
ncbi:MAG: hypothetical protein IT204_05245 [Fimbriimonadaceae bacterium]|nr:hypothetical protein [Fimbriimonadaceae bacterium]